MWKVVSYIYNSRYICVLIHQSLFVSHKTPPNIKIYIKFSLLILLALTTCLIEPITAGFRDLHSFCSSEVPAPQISGSSSSPSSKGIEGPSKFGFSQSIQLKIIIVKTISFLMVLYQMRFAKIMLPFNKSSHKKYYFQTLPTTSVQLICPTPLTQPISGLCDTFKSHDKNQRCLMLTW